VAVLMKSRGDDMFQNTSMNLHAIVVYKVQKNVTIMQCNDICGLS